MFLGTNLHERKSSLERSEKSSDSDDDFQSRGEKFRHSHRRHFFFSGWTRKIKKFSVLLTYLLLIYFNSTINILFDVDCLM